MDNQTRVEAYEREIILCYAWENAALDGLYAAAADMSCRGEWGSDAIRDGRARIRAGVADWLAVAASWYEMEGN